MHDCVPNFSLKIHVLYTLYCLVYSAMNLVMKLKPAGNDNQL